MAEPEDNQAFPQVIFAGDRAIMVLFGDTLDLSTNNAAHGFDAMLRQRGFSWIEEITPAIRGVLVEFDPLTIHPKKAFDQLSDLANGQDWRQAPPNPDRKTWRLPAHYGDESGPDLDDVSAALGLAPEQVIAEHSNCPLRVLMLGFAPGCAYLGSLPTHWDLPRLDYVKPEVPAGSLSVAVRQTVLFATNIPTGWRTIARTPFLSFSRHTAPYFYLSPGDEITFEPVDQTTFENLAREVAKGKQIVAPETGH